MKIHDNGFTERVATPVAPPSAPGKVTGATTSADSPATVVTGDVLQLSGFAARLNSGLAADASNRADRVSNLAAAVDSGRFQIDSAAVSRAIISEGLQRGR